MTTEAMLSCCCACLQCPCHAIYGGRTSFVAEWLGSVTISPPACGCIILLGAQAGLLSTHTINGHRSKFKWSNANDPLNCNLVPNAVGGQRIFTGNSVIAFYDGQTCDQLATGSGPRLAVSISIQAPTVNCVTGARTPWRASALLEGIEAIFYEAPTLSCDPPGIMKRLPAVPAWASGDCQIFQTSPAAVATWAAGGFSIT